jgi:hypothetical protein
VKALWSSNMFDITSLSTTGEAPFSKLSPFYIGICHTKITAKVVRTTRKRPSTYYFKMSPVSNDKSESFTSLRPSVSQTIIIVVVPFRVLPRKISSITKHQSFHRKIEFPKVKTFSRPVSNRWFSTTVLIYDWGGFLGYLTSPNKSPELPPSINPII